MDQIRVFIDNATEEDELVADINVNMVMPCHGRERHITVTTKGITIDMVLNGCVDSTICRSWEELDPKDHYCTMCGSSHEETLRCQVLGDG